MLSFWWASIYFLKIFLYTMASIHKTEWGDKGVGMQRAVSELNLCPLQEDPSLHTSSGFGACLMLHAANVFPVWTEPCWVTWGSMQLSYFMTEWNSSSVTCQSAQENTSGNKRMFCLVFIKWYQCNVILNEWRREEEAQTSPVILCSEAFYIHSVIQSLFQSWIWRLVYSSLANVQSVCQRCSN